MLWYSPEIVYGFRALRTMCGAITQASAIPFTFSIRPTKRVIARSSAGVTDGEVSRIAEIAKLYPPLLPVGAPIIASRIDECGDRPVVTAAFA